MKLGVDCRPNNNKLNIFVCGKPAEMPFKTKDPTDNVDSNTQLLFVSVTFGSIEMYDWAFV